MSDTQKVVVERMARVIAARKCGIADTTGSRLPDDLWRQALPDARAALEAAQAGERDAILRTLVGAGQRVLNGLNERIDEATEGERRVPVFDGIAELSDALTEAHASLSPNQGDKL